MSDQGSMFGPVRKWGRLEFPLPEYRAPEHGRDELAALIHTSTDPGNDPEPFAKDYEIADAILSAGWRHQ